MEKPKSAKIEQVHKDEAQKLKTLYDACGPESQLKFGGDNLIGSQAMVSHYLLARSPLNLNAALKFAKGLRCSVSDFSPRLDAELGEILELVAALPKKPGGNKVTVIPMRQSPAIQQVVERMEAVDDAGKSLALGAVIYALKDYPSASQTNAG